MIDPISLSAIGAVAITEGIKFLYGQASDILKRWSDRREAEKSASAQLSKTEPVEVKLPALFDGQLSDPQIHYDVVALLDVQLRELRKDLMDYADGIEKVDMDDKNLLQRVDALRQTLEAVYQQRLTFQGERRAPSGPLVESSINVEEVAGYVAAVRARHIIGNVKAEAQAKHVVLGAQFIGVDADTIG
jgi:hypothetical protein